MGTTTLGLPYPAETDYVTDGAAALQALAEAVDLALRGGATADDNRLDVLEALAPFLVDRRAVAAAGDLLVGTADDTLGRLARGTAGQYLGSTADGIGWTNPPAGPAVAVKSVDTSRGGVGFDYATPDPELQLPLLANSRYLFDAVVLGACPAGTATMNLGIGAPIASSNYAANARRSMYSALVPVTSGTPMRSQVVRPLAEASTQYGDVASTVNATVQVVLQAVGFVETNAAGNLSVRWGNYSSGGNTMVTYAGSWLRAIKL